MHDKKFVMQSQNMDSEIYIPQTRYIRTLQSQKFNLQNFLT